MKYSLLGNWYFWWADCGLHVHNVFSHVNERAFSSQFMLKFVEFELLAYSLRKAQKKNGPHVASVPEHKTLPNCFSYRREPCWREPIKVFEGLLCVLWCSGRLTPAKKKKSVSSETAAPPGRRPALSDPGGSLSGASSRGAAAAASPSTGYQSFPWTGAWRRAKPPGSMNCNDYLFPNIVHLLTPFMSSRLLSPCLLSDSDGPKLRLLAVGFRVLSRCTWERLRLPLRAGP